MVFVSVIPSRLIEAKDVVFECGPKCGCGPSCVNRTSQRGLKYRFEVVFRYSYFSSHTHTPLCMIVSGLCQSGICSKYECSNGRC